MSTAASREQFSFQAEIKQLLHLLSHSLYQSKEIAVRELVSNASDALDKMRFVAMTDDADRDDAPLGDRRRGAQDASELIIRDNGVGMTRDELVPTSARSPTAGRASSSRAVGQAAPRASPTSR